MNQIKGSGCEHMKFLTFGTSLHKMKHPTVAGFPMDIKTKIRCLIICGSDVVIIFLPFKIMITTNCKISYFIYITQYGGV